MSKKDMLKDYTEVKDRLKWYKEDYPDYRVETEVIAVTENNDSVIVRAYLYRSAEEQERGLPHSSGLAEELRGAGFINKTSHVENCETSALGRALANIDYTGTDKRPSKEEMDKVNRTKKYNKQKDKVKSEVEESSVEKTEEHDAPKVEKTGSVVDVESKIAEFEEAEALVDWFSTELAKRKGSKGAEFKEKYLPIVQERASELLA